MGIQKKNLVILLFICFNAFIFTAYSQKKETSKRNKKYSQKILRDIVPLKQQNFMKNLGVFAVQYKTSTNAIQKFLLREKRKLFLKEQLKDRLMQEWVGRILKLQTTENGKALLEIELPVIHQDNADEIPIDTNFRVSLETWKNSQTDLDYKTLILPETPLHAWLANFNEGEWVVFSGNSFAGEKDYLKEASPNETDAMLAPRFILKFKFFEKIDLSLEGQTSEGNTSIAKKTEKNRGSKSIGLRTSNTITIRYYKYYRLSNYDWDYRRYIDRFNQLVRYNWNNHPPADYLDGSNPKGGEVFVTVTIKRDGRLNKFQVNSFGEISATMSNSALESVRAVSLPPLPEDFPDEELKVEFRFEHNRISHLIKKNFKIMETVNLLRDNKTDDNDSIFSKMEQKIIQKQFLTEARASFHEELKQEFSSHFRANQRFSPNLELQIELSIDVNGKVIEKKLVLPSKSKKFRLAVMNGLGKARMVSLPKSLHPQAPYSIRLRVIP